MRLSQPEIGIARIGGESAIEAGHCIAFSALDRDAGPSVQGAGMVRLQGEAAIVGSTGLRRHARRALRIGAHRPITRDPLSRSFERMQYLHRLARSAERRQGDGTIDGEIGVIGSERESGGEPCLRQLVFAEPLGQRTGIVDKSGVARMVCDGLRDHGERLCPLAPPFRGSGLFEPLPRGLTAHWSRNQPLIAIRPCGAKGGTKLTA